METKNIIQITGQTIEKSKVGGKAFSLNLIKSLGIPIPNAVVITTDFFLEYLIENDLIIPINKLLRSNDLSKKEKIRLIIYKTDFTHSLTRELEAALSKLDNNLAIRSSFPFEDTDTYSGAGHFLTLNNVENNTNEVSLSIRKCWTSIFDSIIDLNTITDIQQLKLAVVLQDFIVLKKSGVAFSRDPIDHSESILVESSLPNKLIVDGGAGDISTYKVRGDYIETLSKSLRTELNKEQLLTLAKYTHKLSKQFNGKVDVEWGLTLDGEFNILQARSITTINDESLNQLFDSLTFIDIEDEQLLKLPLSPYYLGLVEHHWKKRHWMKLELMNHNLRVYKVGFIIFKRSDLLSDSLADLLEETFDSKYLYTMFEKDNKSFNRAMFKEDFAEYFNNFYGESSETDSLVVWVSEFFKPEISGLATRSTNNTYLIEYVKGDLEGLIQNGSTMSKLIVDDTGKGLYEDINYTNGYYSFDDDWKVCFLRCDPIKVVLNQSQIQSIITYTDIMFQKFGECRIEWIYNGKEIIIFDLSIEQKTLDFNLNSQTQVISRGICKGNTLILNELDLAKLNDVITKRRSVVPSIAELEDHNRDEVLELKDAILRRNKAPYVIVAPYPDINLSIFIDDVDGYIFERGAIMSHLAIILRERKIPALIVKGLIEQLEKTSSVEIINDEVSFIEREATTTYGEG